MDKIYNGQTWVGSLCQRFEAVCHEVDDFVNKDTVKYVENHMQTVGNSVKKLYSDVQDILPPLVDPVRHVTQAIPSKQIDLIGTYTRSTVDIKENNTDVQTNKSFVEERPLIPDNHSQDNFVEDQPHCKDESSIEHNDESSHESLDNHLGNRYIKEEGAFCNTFLESDASVFENADLGIKNDVDSHMGIDVKTTEGTPSLSPSEDVKPDLVQLDTIDCNSTDSNSVSSHGFSSSESSEGLSSNNGGATTKLACSSYAFPLTSDGLTSDDTITTGEAFSGTRLFSNHKQDCKLAHFEALKSCSEIGAKDNSIVDIEDLNMETIDLSDKKQLDESCVIVEDKLSYDLSCRSGKSRSYKKIIQDAFALRKRLTKEYKQLAIWYGDIDTEFNPGPEEITIPNFSTTLADLKKSAGQDLEDSEWELV